jgi:3-oxoacyl-[acyl-carrier protein] reductase
VRHQGRVVLVTGGAGGIGAAIIERYLREGAAVGIVDLDKARGEALVRDWERQGFRTHFHAADVGNFDACARACDDIRKQLGPIDTLINNAGISPKHDGRPMPIHQMDPSEWARVMDVNLNSAFNFTRLLAGGMIDRGFGRIVSMSSVAGKAYLDLVAAHYSTTKAALIGFTRHLAGELGPHGITVNALAPGRIDTPLLRTVSAEANAAVVDQTPLRRLGKPAEVADVCCFLTAADGNFVTGQVIDVSGGWLMT